MVNFKCCPNIFVIFGEKKRIYGFFFFFKKKLNKLWDTWPQSTTWFSDTWPTVAMWTIIHVARRPRGFRTRQGRGSFTWPTCCDVASMARGPVATWTTWPRCELHISQQPDLSRCPHVANDTW
jgi:hypothetical protein